MTGRIGLDLSAPVELYMEDCAPNNRQQGLYAAGGMAFVPYGPPRSVIDGPVSSHPHALSQPPFNHVRTARAGSRGVSTDTVKEAGRESSVIHSCFIYENAFLFGYYPQV